ncbi:MAG: hypothetical protein IJH53_00650 [Oscillospiraceae bacterium]|nr:hypothetical protein [Oscillospiraceae bacterium]
MRKSLIITVAIILLCLCGCEAVVPVSESSEPQKTSDMLLTTTAATESKEMLEATITSSVNIDVPEMNDEESGTPTDAGITEDNEVEPVTKEEPRSPESVQPSFEVVIADKPSEQNETPEQKPTESPKEPEQPKPTEPPAPPAPTEPALAEPPAPTEPPTQTEPPAPVETEPPVETQPKTAYDYEFDINAIRADCIAIGQSMGYTMNTSLNPQNATWWNPVTASESNQGSTLRSALEQYIRFHTVENLSAYGLDEITEFNIYCESIGGGSYAIYFVFA